MTETSKDDENILGEIIEKMNQSIRRGHKEKKEASERANKERSEEEQIHSADIWHNAKEGEEEARTALRDNTIRMRKEAAAKTE